MYIHDFLDKQLNYEQLYVISHFLDGYLLKFYNFSFYSEHEKDISFLKENKNQTLSLNDILDSNHKEYDHILFALISYTDSDPLFFEVINNLG